MITSRNWSIIFTAGVLLGFSRIGSALNYTLSTRTLRPGERVKVEVRLKTEQPAGEDGLEPPEMKDDLLTQSKQLVLLDRDIRREGNEWVWHYEISAYSPGNVTIPPIEIRHGPQNYSTEALQVEVLTERSEKDEELRPEFGAVSPYLAWAKWLRRILALFFVGGVAAYLLRRWKPRPIPLQPPLNVTLPEEDPRLWLQKQILALKNRLNDAAEPEQGVIVDDLTRIIREYFTRKWRLPATAWTSAELRDKFEGETLVTKIHPVFSRCDQYKFSGDRSISAGPLASFAVLECEKILLCGT